jgi:hypothetical protein
MGGRGNEKKLEESDGPASASSSFRESSIGFSPVIFFFFLNSENPIFKKINFFLAFEQREERMLIENEINLKVGCMTLAPSE